MQSAPRLAIRQPREVLLGNGIEIEAKIIGQRSQIPQHIAHLLRDGIVIERAVAHIFLDFVGDLACFARQTEREIDTPKVRPALSARACCDDHRNVLPKWHALVIA